ncbi:hypothetical protein AYY18_17105 [Morganella psychrotolerans]|uniref:Uncharacterized protein n=1 Tax=Morganella psychrotolerans TaxID=368603 RepID=A0A1B8HS33_9GAMM|nr:hypothetical protein AYY18_17105 [Morganella psychrotolerans]
MIIVDKLTSAESGVVIQYSAAKECPEINNKLKQIKYFRFIITLPHERDTLSTPPAKYNKRITNQ